MTALKIIVYLICRSISLQSFKPCESSMLRWRCYHQRCATLASISVCTNLLVIECRLDMTNLHCRTLPEPPLAPQLNDCPCRAQHLLCIANTPQKRDCLGVRIRFQRGHEPSKQYDISLPPHCRLLSSFSFETVVNSKALELGLKPAEHVSVIVWTHIMCMLQGFVQGCQ